MSASLSRPCRTQESKFAGAPNPLLNSFDVDAAGIRDATIRVAVAGRQGAVNVSDALVELVRPRLRIGRDETRVDLAILGRDDRTKPAGVNGLDAPMRDL